MAHHPRRRILLIFASALLMVVAAVWFINERRGLLRGNEDTSRDSPPLTIEPTPSATIEQATPSVDNTEASATPLAYNPEPANPTPQTSPPPAAIVIPESSALADPNATLLIPVAGVRFEDLQDTFKDARSDGRVHDAIDIIAPRGTPVLACADGRIVKLFQSERGGITLYQLAPDEKTVYYYAHLDRYAEGIAEGNFARRGDLLAYVGDTGNAGAGNCHLHFAVSLISNPRDIHNGTYLNPYDLFKAK